MSPIVRNTIVICALIGLASALASTYMHYQLVHDPTYSSFCDIDENVSCTQVYLSRFGSIGGIPVALLGAFWFGLVLLLSVAAGRGSGALAETIGGYMLVLSTVGLAAVLFLGFESFFCIGSCLFAVCHRICCGARDLRFVKRYSDRVTVVSAASGCR